jgi:hypothetical protein
LSEQWETAIDAVNGVLYHLESSIEEENVGENRKRLHRLCIIDRAEQAAHNAVEAARMHGRVGHAHIFTLAFVFDKSTKFSINAMLAYGEGDHHRHDVWLEASRLIESPEFVAKGKEDLDKSCCFPWRPELVTNDVSEELKARMDDAPGTGKPFAMADRCSSHAWAYNVCAQIYHRIRTKVEEKKPKRMHEDEDDDSYPYKFEHNKYNSKADNQTEAAGFYLRAGYLFSAASDENCEPLRLLCHRRASITMLAAEAEAAVEGARPEARPLLINTNHVLAIVKAIKIWHKASCATAETLASDEQDKAQRIAALDAELAETVRLVAESDLYNRPEENHDAWTVALLSQLTTHTTQAERSAMIVGEELGSGAYYRQRAKVVDPTLSPAHEKMRFCWERAAKAVDPSGCLEAAATTRAAMQPQKVPVVSKAYLWLAVNYAHLADGLYADAAAYFLRASQATTMGDAEQERCWRTAAERLKKTADIVFDKLRIFAIYPERHESDFTSLEPVNEVFNLPWTGWVRCGEFLSLMRSAGNTGDDGAALSRALVSLMEEQERVHRSVEPSAASCLFRCENEVPLRKRVLASIQEILDGFASAAAKVLGDGAGGRHFSVERIQQLCKIAVLAVTLCEKCREMWKRNSLFRFDQYPNHIERGAEWAAQGLTSVVAALRAEDEEIVLQAYMEAVRQNEEAAAVLAEQPVSPASADS